MFQLTRQIIRSSTVRQYSTSTSSSGGKKIGAVKGGLFGFLTGVTATGVGSYYYLLDQYKLANNVIIADVVALQSSIANLEKHIKSLEESKK